MKKKGKHKPCSYMTPSPDGRKKTTIRKYKEKEAASADVAFIEKMDKFVKHYVYW